MVFSNAIVALLLKDSDESISVSFPTRIEYDTRRILKPSDTLFLAIDTDARSGVDFVIKAFKMGVRNYILPKGYDVPKEIQNNSRIKWVENTLEYVVKSARKHRVNYKGDVIAITGSRGKTIIKEWLAEALVEEKMDVAWSPRSYNSRLGVALSILTMSLDKKWWLLEVGISRKGEMLLQEELVQPNIGILTCITHEHAEGFSSEEEKYREKLKLFKNSNWFIDGTLFVNQSNYEHNKELVNVFLKKLGLDAKNNFPEISTLWEIRRGIRYGEIIIDKMGKESCSLDVAFGFLNSRSNRRKNVILGPLNFATSYFDEILKRFEAIDSFEFHCIGWSQSKVISNVHFYNDQKEFLDADISFESSDILIKSGKGELNEIIRALDSSIHKAFVQIDLDKVRSNVKHLKSKIGKGMLMAMVKAESYGAGSEEISMFLQEEGVDGFGVAYLPEAIALRKRGIQKPVLIMNVDSDFDLIEKNNLSIALYSFEQLEELIKYSNKSSIKVHVKVNTGMNRLGFNIEDLKRLKLILEKNKITVKGIMSHFHAADSFSNKYSNDQLLKFEVAQKLWPDSITHIHNTSGILHQKIGSYTMYRAGIGIYGIDPIGVSKELQPAFNVYAKVIQVKEIKKGEFIGYGEKPIDKDSKVAILNIGYADGVNRQLGNGNWSIEGYPTLGNICMDFLFLDVTNADVTINDELALFSSTETIESMANKLNTIAYEVMTSFTGRLNKRYIQE